VRADGAWSGSTRETAPSYHVGMRSPIILLPLLFILADGVACKDDEPTGAEFGEPCGYDLETEKTMNCVEDLECDIGSCKEKCDNNGDCRLIEGYNHTCSAGVCQIRCNETTKECPQDFAIPFECVLDACVSAL
jgi:hypothetical protein